MRQTDGLRVCDFFFLFLATGGTNNTATFNVYFRALWKFYMKTILLWKKIGILNLYDIDFSHSFRIVLICFLYEIVPNAYNFHIRFSYSFYITLI